MKSFYLFPVYLLLAAGAVYAAGPENSTAQEEKPEATQATTQTVIQEMKTVTVTASGEKAAGPVDGYKAAISATGTKTDTPLLQTPVSVQVISRQVMDDQQVLTIDDAVKNVSGVYKAHAPDGNTMDRFNIRGFEVDAYGATYVDGVKDFSRSPGETSGLERIEVLKGPAAIMYGRIEPGGLVNRVTKRPQEEAFVEIEQQVGSYNFYRTTLDANGPMTNDKSLLYRVNVAYEDTDGYKDYTHNQRIYLAPQLSWKPDEDTQVRAGLEYQDDDRSWADTYGTIGDDNGPVDIPVETNLHDKDDHYTAENATAFIDWSHQLTEDWRIQQRLTYNQRNSVAEGSWVDEADAAGNYSRVYWGWEDEKSDAFSTNLEVLGKINTDVIQHTILIGLDYYDEDYDSGGWSDGGTAVISNIHNPDYSAPYDADYTSVDYWYTNLNKGIYIQDQIALLDQRLHLLLGARYDDANNTMTYDVSRNEANDRQLTWRTGVLYQLMPVLSVYFSYVEGFGASNFDWTTGKAFDPQTSHQYEVGSKWEITPKTGLNVAIFQLIKDNLTMADPLDPTKTTLAGDATSEGVELDLNGEILPGWDIIASYAYTDAVYTHSDTMQGERLYNIPKHGASIWTTYEIAGTNFEIGGGAVYRSSRLGTQKAWDPVLYPYTMDAYTVLDLMVAYNFKVVQQAAKVQINVTNATDERYYPSSYGDKNRISQGEPRMIVGSAQITF